MKKLGFFMVFVCSLLVIMVGCSEQVDKKVEIESKEGNTSGEVVAMKGAEQDREPVFVKGEVLLKFKSDVGEDLQNQIIEEYDCSVLSVVEKLKVYKVSIPEDKTVPEMVDALSKDKRIEYAEPNMIYKVQ